MRIDWTRVRRMLEKELRQIFRDPRMGRIVFIAPVIQLVIFGYAVNTDIRDTPMFVVDHDRTFESRQLIDALTASGYFRVVKRSDRPGDMALALDRGEVIMGVEIPAGYTKDLKAGRGATIQVLTDGSNSNTATIAQGNALRIIRDYAARRVAADGGGVPAGVDLRIRAWFNPDLASRVYNVPAVLGVIVLLMSGLLTAVAVVRERELGTMEQLLVTPMRPVELILGKTLPMALIASIQIILVTLVAILWFDVPFRGSLLALIIAAAIYIVSGLSFGLLISTVARTLQEALMVMFLFFMPAIILSGFMFPIFTMPEFFQWLTYLNPIRHFLEIVRPIFLKGAGVADLWPSYVYLMALAAAGFSFLVGCATGVDACFRLTLAERCEWSESTFVACAFADRLQPSERRGLFASVVVPDGLSPVAALRRRTLWMVKRAELVVLFPDDPLSGHWGRGSTLAFRAATEQLKPVFVVSRTAPPRSPVYQVADARLFDVADGYWAVPHPVASGTCDEEI